MERNIRAYARMGEVRTGYSVLISSSEGSGQLGDCSRCENKKLTDLKEIRRRDVD